MEMGAKPTAATETSKKLSANFNSAVMRFADLERYAKRTDDSFQRDERKRQDGLRGASEKETRIANLFADPFPQVFYASALIANSILLEQHLMGIAGTVQKAMGFSLSMADLKGSLIERFRKYSAGVIHLPLSLTDPDWEFLIGLTRLRNTLVHNNGEVSDKSAVQAFTTKQGIAVEDGRVYLDLAQVLPLLERTSDLVREIYEAALQQFPVALPSPDSAD